MPIVRDYTALISQYSLNSLPGTAVFISFSFPNSVPAEYNDTYSAEGLATFRPLNAAEKAVARQAVAELGAASGITLFEVAPGEGDIRISAFDLDVLTPDRDDGAFAYYPSDRSLGSDIFMGLGLNEA